MRLRLSHSGISVLVLAFLSTLTQSTAWGESPAGTNITITTYLDTQAPPGKGGTVCLADLADPVGTIQDVRLAPGHALYHDRWEVIAVLNSPDASRVRMNSVAHLKLPDPDRHCGGSTARPFLEIDGGTAAAPPITDHAVLKGEVDYFAEIAWPREPEPWWRKGTVWAACFVLICAGVGLILLARHAASARGKSTHTGGAGSGP